MTYQLGDKVWVRKAGVRHYGIVVGCVCGILRVVHASKATGVVEVATLDAFAGRESVTVEARAAAGHECSVVRRAMSLVGRRYNLFHFNCEHAATYAMTGRASSRQLGTAIGVGVIALLAIAYARAA